MRYEEENVFSGCLTDFTLENRPRILNANCLYGIDKKQFLT